MSVEPISSPALDAGLARVAPRARSLARLRGLLPLAYAACDGALAWLALTLAWWLRYHSGFLWDLDLSGQPYTLNLPVTEESYRTLEYYRPYHLIFVGLLVGALVLRGTYSRRFLRSLYDEATSVVSASTIAIAILIIVLHFHNPFSFSRLMFIYLWALTVGLLVGARVVGRGLRGLLRRRGIGLRSALIVGCGPPGRAIMQSLLAQPALGYQVIGFLDDAYRRDLGRIAYLGAPACLDVVIAERQPDEVIIALPSSRHEEIVGYVRACRASGARFRLVPDFYELSLNQVDTQYLDGIPLIGLRDLQLSGPDRLVKRAVDVVVASLGLLVASPVLLLAAVAIKLDSPGPILHQQVRVGKGGRHFTLYKFRSMKVNADAELERLRPSNEAGGVTFKMRADPRRTRVGRWLRRLSIDELPQLWNVLRGDMSLVGPRPPLPSEVSRYEEWHRHRLEVAPGLTGLWQVSGRSEVPFDEMVLMDLWYIEHWSLGLDLKILFRTIPAVLLARGAY